MLLGGKRVQTNILNDASAYAEEKGFQLIFGAMVGGCSKGLQYYDSDYDTRFLYFDKNENRIFYPWDEKEETLKHRKYFDDTVSPYEWIPLWEATSFFQFLKNPAFDGKQSFGLYNIVGWTLQSPYTWDPYGLSEKVMPLVNEIFRREYYVPYHVKEIERLWRAAGSAGDEIVAKDYMYAIYEALCILYADKYNVYPPVYMKTLAQMLLGDELIDGLFEMIHLSQKSAEEYCLANKGQKMHESHCYGTLRREDRFDHVIRRALSTAEKIEDTKMSEETIDRQLTKIYRVIEESVYHEQKVQRAED